jgi:hypothetical protein
MPDMSQDDIVASLEEVRAGNADPACVSYLENYLVELLLSSGKDAVGMLLLDLEGMRFSLAEAPSCLKKAAALKKQTESWDDLWERAGKQLGNLDNEFMNDKVEYLAMITARHFGKDG